VPRPILVRGIYNILMTKETDGTSSTRDELFRLTAFARCAG
jgi:hypothetical protein